MAKSVTKPKSAANKITANGMTRERFSTIDGYIAAFPPDVQEKLQQVRETIAAVAPKAVEAIKYNMPTFTLGKSLVHFAAFTGHIGLYPTPTGLAEFQRDLAGYKTGKGSVQFPFDQPMPLPLIRKIVQYRIGEMEAAKGLPAAKRKR